MKTEGTINWLDSCIVCDGRQERRKEGMPPGMSESVLSEPVNVVNTVFLCSPILLSEGDMIVNPRESVGYAQTLLPIKHISFRYKVEPAPYRKHLQ